MRLQNKVVVITGSARGIGRAIATRFATEGARVVINYRTSEADAQATAAQVEAAGGKALISKADVSQPIEVDRLFAETMQAFGQVDVLVNNAGPTDTKPFMQSVPDDWRAVFENNLFAAMLCAQRAIPLMQERGGKILNTVSIRAIEGRPGIMAFSAAKAAMVNFTKTLAKEVAPHITVNAVAPGFVYKPDFDSYAPEMVEKFIGGTLIHRWITPAEVAEAFLLLATNDAMTGEVLVIDGGFTLKNA